MVWSKPSGFYLGGFLFALEFAQRMRTVDHWCILFRIRMTLDNQLVTVRNNIEQRMVICAQIAFLLVFGAKQHLSPAQWRIPGEKK